MCNITINVLVSFASGMNTGCLVQEAVCKVWPVHVRLLATVCMTCTLEPAAILCKTCMNATESSKNDEVTLPVVLIRKDKEALCV